MSSMDHEQFAQSKTPTKARHSIGTDSTAYSPTPFRAIARATVLFSQTITPRFYETDALGHINNVSIAGWLEVSRMGYIASFDNTDDVSANNWALASVQIEYVAETFFGADVELRISGAHVGNSSLTIDSEIWQNEQLTVRAKAVLVYFDATNKTKHRIPDSLRRQIDAQSGRS